MYPLLNLTVVLLNLIDGNNAINILWNDIKIVVLASMLSNVVILIDMKSILQQKVVENILVV